MSQILHRNANINSTSKQRSLFRPRLLDLKNGSPLKHYNQYNLNDFLAHQRDFYEQSSVIKKLLKAKKKKKEEKQNLLSPKKGERQQNYQKNKRSTLIEHFGNEAFEKLTQVYYHQAQKQFRQDNLNKYLNDKKKVKTIQENNLIEVDESKIIKNYILYKEMKKKLFKKLRKPRQTSLIINSYNLASSNRAQQETLQTEKNQTFENQFPLVKKMRSLPLNKKVSKHKKAKSLQNNYRLDTNQPTNLDLSQISVQETKTDICKQIYLTFEEPIKKDQALQMPTRQSKNFQSNLSSYRNNFLKDNIYSQDTKIRPFTARFERKNKKKFQQKNSVGLVNNEDSLFDGQKFSMF